MTTKMTHTMELAGDEIVLTEKVTFKADNPDLLRLLGVGGPITAEKYAEIKLDAVAPVVDAQPQQTEKAQDYTVVLDAIGTSAERKKGFHAIGRLTRALGKSKNCLAAKTLREAGIVALSKIKGGKIEIVGKNTLLSHSVPANLRPINLTSAEMYAGSAITATISPEIAEMLEVAPVGSQMVVAGSDGGLQAVLLQKPHYPGRGGRLPKS